ncbi:ATP-binding protein [Microbacterium sp.]|uniref:ATP-binding protein n=1 Tax=Microbacterium sp. TaxID=51671 RepID=UPI0039E36B52
MAGPHLTRRERAVLEAVERRLSNAEIAAELFVSVRTVESHIASLRRKLAVDSRAQLIAAAGDLREASVTVPANPLRGRGRDLSQVRALLAGHGWVTIVGPGGVGKTRLALELARADAERVPLVVELEHAGPDDVMTRIARALGLEATSGSDLDGAVAVALGAHRHLLLLDNADRVGPATADAVSGLRERAGGFAVLVTSRTPLGAAAEIVYPLPPLATEGVDPPAAAVLIDRLGAGGRTLDAREQEAVQRICARLDGVPLALELAASVARHLPLRELESRLERDLATLDRAAPDGRHRTLETAFDWTWDLLGDDEREVLCRLSALPRTFDLDLAEAVTSPGAAGVVLRLLDHSLIVPVGGEPLRFRLLAVMREFVHARTDPAVAEDVLRRHAEHIAAVAVGFARTARTDATPAAAHMSTILCPEVNAALRWALGARHPSALELAPALAIGVQQYGSDLDSIAVLAQAAVDGWVLGAATAQDLQLLGDALAYLDVDLVSSLARTALALAHDPDSSRAAHQLAGLAAAYRGEEAEALPHLDEAERLAAELGQTWNLGSIRQARGLLLRGGPDPATALGVLESAMRAYARAGDLARVNNVRYMMAAVAADSPADRDRAARWAAECRTEAEAMFNAHEAAHARVVQATLRLDEAGDLGELCDTFRQFGDLRCVHRVLMLRAESAATSGERIAFLDGALEAATLARDQLRQIAAAEQLVHAQHVAGNGSAALAALDRLHRLAGREAAEAACPPELRDDFVAEWNHA